MLEPKQPDNGNGVFLYLVRYNPAYLNPRELPAVTRTKMFLFSVQHFRALLLLTSAPPG